MHLFLKHTIVAMLFSVTSANAQQSLDALLQQYNTRSIPYISVEGLRALQTREDIILLDTREQAEFGISRLQGAQYAGFNDFSAKKISEEIKDKNTPIIVYCSLGIRSEEIGEKLQKAGFTNVQNLYGGIFEWKNKGYPVLNKTQQETDSIHTFSKAWSKWLKAGIPVYDDRQRNKRSQNDRR